MTDGTGEKIGKKTCQGSWSLGQDTGPPKYKSLLSLVIYPDISKCSEQFQHTDYTARLIIHYTGCLSYNNQLSLPVSYALPILHDALNVMV